METRHRDWSVLTRTARDHFREGRFARALDLYEHALDALGEALRSTMPTPALIMAQVETLQERAAALVRLGRLREAEAAHARAHAFVHGLATAPRLPASLRSLAEGLCTLAHTEWQAFRTLHGAQLGEVGGRNQSTDGAATLH